MVKDAIAPVLAYLLATTFKERLSHMATAVLGALLVAAAWSAWAWVEGRDLELSPERFRKEQHRAEAVTRVLDGVRHATGAWRALAFRFHNSTRFLGGGHRLYMSAVAESAGPGLKSAIVDWQDVPLSVVAGIQDVLAGRCVATPIAKSGPVYESLHAETGISEVVKCPIRDLDGDAIGLWGVSFTHQVGNGAEERIIEALKARDSLVTGLFSGG